MRLPRSFTNGLWMLPLWLVAMALFFVGQWVWGLF